MFLGFLQSSRLEDLTPQAGSQCCYLPFPMSLLGCAAPGRFFLTGVTRAEAGTTLCLLCLPTSLPVASGLYVQSSEALHVITNVIHANGDRGVTVAQSGQLTRVVNNSISCNRQSGVRVEAQCRVELRGNGIYDNRGCGVVTKGDSTIVIENDIIGNRGSGLQLLPRSDTKVCVCRTWVAPVCSSALEG